MRIEKLEIRNFGGLCEKQIKLQSGINVVYGENESGKSTLFAFIRGMFFGQERLRGKGARTDSYNHYEPWGNPACYAGNMEFSCGKRRFRLERNFYKELEAARLFCMDDGEALSVENGDLTMLLGGVGASVFDNTVSVGQLKGVTGRELAVELQNYLAGSPDGSCGTICPDEAVRTLKRQKKELLLQKKEMEEQKLLELRQLEAKEELLLREQEQCQAQIKAARRTLSEQDFVQAEKEIKPGAKSGKKTSVWRRIWTLICGFFMRLFHPPFGERPTDAEASGEGKSSQNREDEPAGRAEGKLQRLEEEFQERQILLGNVGQEKEELQEQLYEPQAAEEEAKAVERAIQMLERAIFQMQKKTGSRLNRRCGEILSELTGGKYCRVIVSGQMEVQIESFGRRLELFQLSRGTLEQVYFALRMAAGEILCAGEELPVILDDVFAMYDERRLVRALQWLHQNKKQVILLTCHRRERELLEYAGIPYATVTL